MATVNAPTPARMEAIDGKSIISVEPTETNLKFWSRAGTLISDLVVRNPRSYWVKAIRTVGSSITTYRDIVIRDWYRTGFPNKKLAPNTPPAGRGTGVAWRPDAKMVAISHDSAPFITAYSRTGDVFTKLADPSTPDLPAGNGTALAWSPNGVLGLMGIDVSPFVHFFYWNGTIVAKRLTITSGAANGFPTLPAGVPAAIDWSQDNSYVAMAVGATPYLQLFKFDGTLTFSLLPNPVSPPGSPVSGVAWSPDSTYLAVTMPDAPYLVFYKRSGDVLTRLVVESYGLTTTTDKISFGSLPTAAATCVAWSPDSNYLVISHQGAPHISVYKRIGDTFVKLADPEIAAAGNGRAITWSPDGNYVGLAHFGSPYVTTYRFKNEILTKLPKSIVSGTPGIANDLDFAPDGKHLAVAHEASPYVSFYKSALGPLAGVPIRADGVSYASAVDPPGPDA